MQKIGGIVWPDDVGEKWRHALKHVLALDWTLAHCSGRAVAVQAGGNIGLWPLRMAAAGFERVLTFEPDARSRACLKLNVPKRVEVFESALGAEPDVCGIAHRSLGSHNVIKGDSVPVVPLDYFNLEALDLLQLDVEGYEWHALAGAMETIRRHRPIIHLELRNFATKYGHSDADVRAMLSGLGYREIKALPGNDFVFKVLS